MRIECTTTFLHGRERFEKGDIFTVPDADAAGTVPYSGGALRRIDALF